MRVNIEVSIDTENDAFKGDGGYIASKVAEIIRILTKAARKESTMAAITNGIVTGYDRVPMLDTNGNTVGFMTVESR